MRSTCGKSNNCIELVFSIFFNTHYYSLQNLSLWLILKACLKFCEFQPRHPYKTYSYKKIKRVVPVSDRQARVSRQSNRDCVEAIDQSYNQLVPAPGGGTSISWRAQQHYNPSSRANYRVPSSRVWWTRTSPRAVWLFQDISSLELFQLFRSNFEHSQSQL